MDTETQRRAAENESVFRDINERIEKGHEQFDLWGEQEYLCECSDPGCTDRIRLTRAEYERVRSNARWFAIVPGHDFVEVENVVENHGAYAIVEKIDHAGEVAETRDPRA